MKDCKAAGWTRAPLTACLAVAMFGGVAIEVGAAQTGVDNSPVATSATRRLRSSSSMGARPCKACRNASGSLRWSHVFQAGMTITDATSSRPCHLRGRSFSPGGYVTRLWLVLFHARRARRQRFVHAPGRIRDLPPAARRVNRHSALPCRVTCSSKGSGYACALAAVDPN